MLHCNPQKLSLSPYINVLNISSLSWFQAVWEKKRWAEQEWNHKVFEGFHCHRRWRTMQRTDSICWPSSPGSALQFIQWKNKSFQRRYIPNNLKCHSAECLSQWEWTQCYWKNLGAAGVPQNALLRVEKKSFISVWEILNLLRKHFFLEYFFFFDHMTFFHTNFEQP